MADYSFLTTWLLESPREPVFEAIYDQARWPQWWRGVEEAEEVSPGDDGGVGTGARMAWKSLLPYRVEFEVATTLTPSLMSPAAFICMPAGATAPSATAGNVVTVSVFRFHTGMTASPSGPFISPVA